MKLPVKILIIEDDPNISDLISMYVKKMNFEPLIAVDGGAGLEMYYDMSPHCIILDLMLPEIDGWEVCRMIRLDDRHIPILMLTGKGESYDIVKGLEIGADDYMVKPFDPNELSARIKAMLRRAGITDNQQEELVFSNMEINKRDFRLRVNGTNVETAPREMELLYYFAVHRNQVLSRRQLLDNVWGFEFEGDPRTIDVHIKRVRDKLHRHQASWSITTIRGIGYRFEEIHHDKN
ncbi:response regulator transcription factor [Alkalicoccus daliensis]|uniref:DNA-binding response regulator, OmpR family, contains REC and winged-helix (WHTH) domain n=1 Tax=Alkalicoccus daliensis TaxID=745820 RepID=A0A1H0HDZ8_9BACI|nr:response regulator transcription factor [Alkalicoccus daliensis]SDO17071.1 DNA-binding response regulator, OmpR family, contains REC and winged-helix (wHTH) domain [Alkalicoccus daliensis]